MNVALRIIHDVEEDEDVVQTAFMRVLNIGRFVIFSFEAFETRHQ